MASQSNQVYIDDDSLSCILEHLAVISPKSLARCLSVSHRFHDLGVAFLYRNITLETKIPGGHATSHEAIPAAFCQAQHRNRLETWLHSIPSSNLFHIRQLTIRFQFNPEITITPPSPTRSTTFPTTTTAITITNSIEIDQDDLENMYPTLIPDAWAEFISRCHLISQIIDKLVREAPRLHQVNYILDADLTSGANAREFYLALRKITHCFSPKSAILQTPENEPKMDIDTIHPEITTVGLHVTKNCHLGHPLYLSPIITVHASHIRHLRIDDAEMWVDAQLTELMGIGALDTLEVHGAMGLSEKFFEEVAVRHGKTLQTLKLTGARRMDDIALMSRVVPCARGMRVLDLSGSIRTWSRTMEEYSLFQQGGRALVELDVSQCVGLPAQFFHVLARVSPRLERLVASETCFGDGEMEALLHPANRLSSLKVANCNNLTLGFWTVLKSAACCYLKDLEVQGSRGTIEDVMAPILVFHALKKLSPTLTTVSVGPIVHGKPSFSHWCILAHAEKYVAVKRGLLDGFIPNSCGRYLELPVKRLIRAMESLYGDYLVSPFFST